jgi:hypothetical protein
MSEKNEEVSESTVVTILWKVVEAQRQRGEELTM